LRNWKARHQSTQRQTTERATKVNRSTAKKNSDRAYTSDEPTPETKPTPQHRTTLKKQTTTSDTQRHPLWGPTQVKGTHAAELSSGPPSAVHISGRMMRPLEPAASSMGRLETSGRREHARGVAAPHHSQVAEHIGETAPARTGSLCPGESPMHHFACFQGQSPGCGVHGHRADVRTA
jgi:hypothetical protein